jgi:hypothetical protein
MPDFVINTLAFSAQQDSYLKIHLVLNNTFDFDTT